MNKFKKYIMNKFKVVSPLDLRIPDLKNLCVVLGGEKTLRQTLEMLKSQYPHKCPKCEGNGFKEVTVNTYPQNLPDSGWVDQMETFDIVCDLCNGQGYTRERLVAKPIKVEYVKE